MQWGNLYSFLIIINGIPSAQCTSTLCLLSIAELSVFSCVLLPFIYVSVVRLENKCEINSHSMGAKKMIVEWIKFTCWNIIKKQSLDRGKTTSTETEVCCSIYIHTSVCITRMNSQGEKRIKFTLRNSIKSH
jgi:hypothetical protein